MNKTKFFSSLLVVVLFAAASVFTSCKDYDDDIKNLQEQINNRSLKTELEALKSSLETQINTVQSTLNTKIEALNAAIAQKADASTVTALAERVDGLAQQVTSLKVQVDAINEALATFATKEYVDGTFATKAELETKSTTIMSVITGEVSKLENAMKEEAKARGEAISAEEAARKAAIEAVNKAIELQAKALEEYKKVVDTALGKHDFEIGELAKAVEALKVAVGTAEYETAKTIQKRLAEAEKDIDDLQAMLKDYDAMTKDVATLKSDMQQISETINKTVVVEINNLTVFVQKRLTSLVLMPEFYWEGLEGIEVPFTVAPDFKPVNKDRKFQYWLNLPAAGRQAVDVTVKSYMTFSTKKGDICTENAFGDATEPGPWDITNLGGFAGPTSLTWNNLVAIRNQQAKNNDGDLNYVEVSRGGLARYHVNPITANLEGAKIKFFENDAEVYTRTSDGSRIGARPYSEVFTSGLGNHNVFDKATGILEIPFYLEDNAALASMYTAYTLSLDNYNAPYWPFDAFGSSYDYDTKGNITGRSAKPLPFIAAQLTVNDTVTVTSDYGVVTPAGIDIIALADNAALASIKGADGVAHPTFFDKAGVNHLIRDNHLYESAGYNGADDQDSYGAIPMPATHTVAYDGIFKFDFIETHIKYTTYARYGMSSEERTATAGELRAMGLHYEYTLVDYIVGKNVTGESVHMEQVDEQGNVTTDKKSPFFAPRSVTEDGKTISGKVATREVIGREPMVRVDLVDEDGNIVRYGYVKIRIAENAVEAKGMEVTVEFSDIYFNCGEEVRVTWSQMENLILAKLNDGKGMTKQEFEKDYYLDVVGDYQNMPYENPAAVGSTDPAGTLYTDTWEAKRFYFDGKAYKAAVGNDNLKDLDKMTNTNNWFGRVWYTPHDNATAGHNWDESTNVLIWNLQPRDWKANASNLTDVAYYKMRSLVDATYGSKGLSQKEFSTVIRFINKLNGSYIYVTLHFDVAKLHFAYADINRRVLDHWYDFADGYKDNTADTIEVYANVPTPALQGSTNPLDVSSFAKDLKEYWLNQTVVPDIYNKAKFNKYWDAKTNKFLGNTYFQFRLPVKGERAGDINANGEIVNSSTVQYKTQKSAPVNYWEVKGASGATYKLYLRESTTGAVGGKTGDEIWAVKQGSMKADELISQLSVDGVIIYQGYQPVTPNTYEKTNANSLVNSAACDILNYVGMYDKTGKLIKDSYLDGQDGTNDRAFTAFVQVMPNADNCFDPLIGKNFFNVRFLRPVNMWPAETNWKDAPNATQIYPIWKLVYIRDWRQYAVVPAGEEQQFGATAVAGTGLDGKKHKGDFAEGNVTYEFYGIEYLYVNRDEIRSDAFRAPDDRVIKSTEKEIIANTLPIVDIPASTGTNTLGATWEYLKIYNWMGTEAATKDAAGKNALGKPESNAINDILAYTNNGGVVKPFQVYVPISLKYPWGALTDWTQKVWAVITIDPTQGNE